MEPYTQLAVVALAASLMVGSDFKILPAMVIFFVVASAKVALSPSSASLQKTLRPFGIDPRSVTLWARTMGLLTLIDLGTRVHLIPHFYTDTGVMSRSEYHTMCNFFRDVSGLNGCDYDTTPNTWHWSLHFLSGDESFQWFLFGINAFMATALMMGKSSPFATFVLTLLTDSMHQRNHFLHDKGQQTQRMMLLWVSLLQYTTPTTDIVVDKNNEIKNEVIKSQRPRWIVTSGSVAYLGQIACLYWFSTSYKWHEKSSNEWRDGIAAWSSMNVKSFELPIGIFVRDELPIWIPTCYVLFLFFPIGTQKIRCITSFVYICFHVSLGICMWLNLFPYCSAMQFVPLFPPYALDYMSQTSLGSFFLKIVQKIDDKLDNVLSTCRTIMKYDGSYVNPNPKKSPTVHTSDNEEEKLKNKTNPESKIESKSEKSEKSKVEKNAQIKPIKPIIKKQYPLLRRLLPTIALTLIYYWQLSHFKFSVKGYTSWVPIPEMPKQLREIVVALGMRQNWQVFSNTQTPDMPCRVVLVGEVGRPNGREAIKGNPSFINPSEPVFIDLLKYDFPTYKHPDIGDEKLEEILLTDGTNTNNKEKNQEPPLRSFVDIIHYRSYMWKSYIDAARSNVFLLRSLGQFFCRKWDESNELTMNFSADDVEYSIVVHGNENVNESAQKFCEMHGKELKNSPDVGSKESSFDICVEQLIPELLRLSSTLQLRSFGIVDVCPGELREHNVGFCDKLQIKDYHPAFDVKKVFSSTKVENLV